jgi:hypothetical protein
MRIGQNDAGTNPFEWHKTGTTRSLFVPGLDQANENLGALAGASKAMSLRKGLTPFAAKTTPGTARASLGVPHDQYDDQSVRMVQGHKAIVPYDQPGGADYNPPAAQDEARRNPGSGDKLAVRTSGTVLVLDLVDDPDPP